MAWPATAVLALAALLFGCSDGERPEDPKAGAKASRAARAGAPAPVELQPRWLDSANRSVREVEFARDGAGRLWSLGLEHTAAPRSALAPDPELVLRRQGTPPLAVVVERGPALATPQLGWIPGLGFVCAWETRDDRGAAVLRAQVWTPSGDNAPEPRSIQDLAGLPDPIDGSSTGFEAWSAASAASGGAHPVEPDLAVQLGGSGCALVWQALVGAQYELFYARLSSSGEFSAPRRLSHTPSDEWCPSAALAADGQLCIGFDRWEPASDQPGFDLWLALIPAGSDSPVFRCLDAEPHHAAHASIGTDPEGRVWVAYEVCENFGRGAALRDRREPRLLCVDSDRSLHECSVSLPSVADLPKVWSTESGLWLGLRTRSAPPSNNEGGGRNRIGNWRTELIGFGGDLPERFALAGSHGDNEYSASLVSAEETVQVAFAADLRGERQGGGFESPMETAWRLGCAELPSKAGWPTLGGSLEVSGGWLNALPTNTRLPRQPSAWFGDLHRHTHLSRCGSARDGTFLDSVRYARGPGALDFLAITDHHQHLTPVALWRNLRDAERWNAPGSLVVFQGLETMEVGRGHHNLIWADERAVLEGDGKHRPRAYPMDEVIAIPHMLNSRTNPFSARRLDPDRHRLIEVYQGLRGSYEGPNAPLLASDAVLPEGHLGQLLEDYPGQGRPPGLIAASDHRSSGRSFAGVPRDPSPTRRVPPRHELFGHLRAAAAFGTTGSGDGGALDAPTVDLEVTAGDPPIWELEVHGLPVAHVAWFAGERQRGIQLPPGSERALNMRFHLRYRGPERWTGEVARMALSGGQFRAAEVLDGVLLGDPRTASRGPLEVQLTNEPLGLVLEIEPSGDADLTLAVELGERNFEVDLSALEVGQVRQVGREASRAAAPLQVWSLGPVSPPSSPRSSPPSSPPGGPAAQRFRWSDPQPRAGAIHYARVVFQDGSIAWTRTRRDPTPAADEAAR